MFYKTAKVPLQLMLIIEKMAFTLLLQDQWSNHGKLSMSGQLFTFFGYPRKFLSLRRRVERNCKVPIAQFEFSKLHVDAQFPFDEFVCDAKDVTSF